jgi:hypothetical protein
VGAVARSSSSSEAEIAISELETRLAGLLSVAMLTPGLPFMAVPGLLHPASCVAVVAPVAGEGFEIPLIAVDRPLAAGLVDGSKELGFWCTWEVLDAVAVVAAAGAPAADPLADEEMVGEELDLILTAGASVTLET